jgi:hypothetical protein
MTALCALAHFGGSTRFRYAVFHFLFRREGAAVNHKKLFRISREWRLVVRKLPQACAENARAGSCAAGKTQRSLDFVSYTLADERRGIPGGNVTHPLRWNLSHHSLVFLRMTSAVLSRLAFLSGPNQSEMPHC